MDTIEKKRCGDEEEEEEEDLPLLLLPEDFLVQILVRLPIQSLLRFKSVCKSWFALIESSFFIHLHNTFNTTSSSNKFGTFILHAANDFQKRFRENALLMLSSSSVSGSESEGWWSTGSNGLSGGLQCLCDNLYEPGTVGWWSTDSKAVCGKCGLWWSHRVAENDDQVFKVDDDDIDDDDQQQLVLKLDNLGFPSCYQFDKIRHIHIAGSCNGLICLHGSELMDDESRWNSNAPELLRDVSLWNPATRQFRILPKSSSITIHGNGNGNVDSPPPHHRLVAFGFDAETKDYKVVLVSGFKPRLLHYGRVAPKKMECVCRVQVYSLSTDSWRLLEGITSLPGDPFSYPNEVLYLNGSCFFLAAKKSLHSEQGIPPKNNNRFMISLDLTEEIITTIQLPDHRGSEELYLSYLGDKIALFTKACYVKRDENFRFYDIEDFNIWVLNEQSSSSKESWTKLRSFTLPGVDDGKQNIPRGLSNDGEFALLGKSDGMLQRWGGKKMKLYNLVTNKVVKKNFLSCNQVLSKAYAYKPTLVSIIAS